MSSIRRLAVYVSGHGLGHSVRSIEVMNRLWEMDSGLFFQIRTDAPPWIYRLYLKAPYHLGKVSVDVGTVQRTSLCVDREATLAKWRLLLKQWDAWVLSELTALERTGARMILGDIPPFAFHLAGQWKIPSLAWGNFGWDWIYEPWSKEMPAFHEIIRHIRSCYCEADLLMRLPAHEPMSAFPNRVNIPLITRQSTKDRKDIRRALGIEEGVKVVLLALPETDMELIDPKHFDQDEEIRFICPLRKVSGHSIVPVSRETAWFPDLVQASDAVLSKPGYGIMAETYVNRTPLLCVKRDDFRENELLMRWMRNHMTVDEIEGDSLRSGEWVRRIRKLTESPFKSRPAEVHGDREIAETILNRLE
ncbi:MAG TPA: hypothetical protein ENN03_08475 [bacterium]|nr:hypothetical protein [bacterium]